MNHEFFFHNHVFFVVKFLFNPIGLNNFLIKKLELIWPAHESTNNLAKKLCF